jgi:hypothetical protein
MVDSNITLDGNTVGPVCWRLHKKEKNKKIKKKKKEFRLSISVHVGQEAGGEGTVDGRHFLKKKKIIINKSGMFELLLLHQ